MSAASTLEEEVLRDCLGLLVSGSESYESDFWRFVTTLGLLSFPLLLTVCS